MLEEMLEEEKKRPEVNSDDNIENDPINFGSRLSVSMSMLLFVRHNLVSSSCPVLLIACAEQLFQYTKTVFRELKRTLV